MTMTMITMMMLCTLWEFYSYCIIICIRWHPSCKVKVSRVDDVVSWSDTQRLGNGKCCAKKGTIVTHAPTVWAGWHVLLPLQLNWPIHHTVPSAMMFLLLYILCKLATTNLLTVNHIVWQDVKLEVCFFKNLAI